MGSTEASACITGHALHLNFTTSYFTFFTFTFCQTMMKLKIAGKINSALEQKSSVNKEQKFVYVLQSTETLKRMFLHIVKEQLY